MSEPPSSVRVTPASGTTACLGQLVAMHLDLELHRVGLGFVAKPLVATIDAVAMAVGACRGHGREGGHGGSIASFPLVAEARQ